MVSNPKNQGIFFVFQASIFKLLVFVFNKASFQWDMTSPIITFDFGNCTYLWLSMWIRQHLLTYILYSCWFGEFYHQNLYQMPMWNYKRGRRSFHEQKKRAKKRRSTEGPTHCAACTHEKSRVPSCATSAVWDLQSQRFGFRIFAASMKLAPPKKVLSNLGGGLKHVWFLPLPGEMIQCDGYFFKWVESTN